MQFINFKNNKEKFLMGNINKKHYNQQYKTEIELKYKTNTRYLLSLTDKLLKKIEDKF